MVDSPALTFKLPNIAVRFRSPFVEEMFEPVMLISLVPEVREIESPEIRFEATLCEYSVVVADFSLVMSA